MDTKPAAMPPDTDTLDIDAFLGGLAAGAIESFVKAVLADPALAQALGAHDLVPANVAAFARTHGWSFTAAELAAYVEGRIVDEMVARHCTNELSPSDRLAFREDLVHTSLDNGFEARSAVTLHTFKGLPFARRLGELVAAGDRTAGEIHMTLVAEGYDVFVIGEALQNLYAAGVFDDDPLYGGIGPKTNVSVPLGRAGETAKLAKAAASA